jgi:hypothetical protein
MFVVVRAGGVTRIWPSQYQSYEKRGESAGVIFVEENGEGPGVRLKKGER